MGRALAAERDELRARDPRRAARDARAGPRRDRQRLVDRRQAAVDRRCRTTRCTKAAVLSLSRLVADLYAGDGIRCNAVTPGPTATEAWLAEGGLADQQAARTGKTRDEVLAGGRQRAARSAGSRSRRRSPR